MGAGKTTLAIQVADLLGRRFVNIDSELEQAARRTIPELFEERGEVAFRVLESQATLDALRHQRPAVLALGGGAVETASIRRALREHAVTVLVEVEPDVAWERVRGTGRPLAQDEGDFKALYDRRRSLYDEAADATAEAVEDVVLAAGGIQLERGAVGRLGELLPDAFELIADERVLGLHGPNVGLAPVHTVPPGEAAKSVETAERLWRALRLDRGGTLVGFGGGCTTDLAGFLAATYLRGVDWAAVPTTLVGQVDAAIGGKTGINLPEGKNLVGAFHWPAATIVDPDVLATLPEKQRRAGMAEVVKTGLLRGEAVWELDDEQLVRRCAAYKTAVCLRDPLDRGRRQVLNLGHTFAHALEAASDYSLAHGDAVALGLLAALRLSGQPTDAVDEILSPSPVKVDRERAWAALARDKKAEAGAPRLVLLDGPGKPRYGVELPEQDVRRALDELIAE